MKKRRRRYWLYIPLFLTLVGIAAYVFAPDAIKWYVEDRYPEVKILGEVEVIWGEVRFHHVRVKRPGIAVLADLVHVNVEKDIRIEGGELRLDLDDMKTGESGGEGSATGGYSVTAVGMEVSIRKGDNLYAKLEKTSIDSHNVCFEFGSVRRGKLTANVWQGCARRDKSQAQAARVEVPIRIPFKIPRVAPKQLVTITRLQYVAENRVARFNSATIGPFDILGPASVKLSDEPEGEILFFDAPKIVVDHPWIAPHEAAFERVGITAPLSLVRTGAGKFRVRVGGATVHIDPINFAIHGDEECGDWLDFLPHPLPKALQQMRDNYKGRLSFEIRAKPIPHLDIKHNCTYTCSAEPIKTLRSRDFTYMAYDRHGALFERRAGPWSPGWVSIADIAPHIPHAFILMEDPGFYTHRGILPEALENSLKANLASGEFVKGGSTITMQLAKNLWLRRHKTIGRKAYEALLTVALESCLGKPLILEWYMNVVEYGPDLYGIGPAAHHYFRKGARELAPDEAFYLAGLLPRPKDAIHPRNGGMAKTHRLMQILANSGIISEHIVPLKEGEELDTTGWEVND